jgi:hypothetical protein
MLISTHRKLKNVGEAMTNNVPDVVCHFLDIEAQVGSKEEDDDKYGDGPLGELTLVFSMSAINIYCIFDNFIDNQDCEPPENMPRLLDSKMPDQDKEGLDNLLAGILEWSHNVSAQQAMYDGNVNSDGSDTPATIISCLPTNADYPLLRVCCIMSLNHYNFQIFY